MRDIFFLLLFLAIIAAGCSTDEPEPSESPNFVFFLVDDLGWADVGAFGSTFYETPNIDRLAREGVRFTNAYAACPVCSPTRASIMTGKYPARIRVTDWIPGRQSGVLMEPGNRLMARPFEHQMALEETTIAEALKPAGYTTLFAGKWHMGQDSIYWPERQGFDINIGGFYRGSPPGGYFSPYENPRLADGPEGEYLTDRLGRESAQFISRIGRQPFLLYLSFYSVHTPLQAPDSLVAKYERKAAELGYSEAERHDYNAPWISTAPQRGNFRERLVQDHAVYAAMVESMDRNVGRVLDALREHGLEDNTVVFFMSDNGGLATSEGSPTTNAPLRAGKGWLYEGGIREPMIIKWPGRVQGGQVLDTPVTSTDFYPTILEMAELPLRPGQHMDGESLVPILTESGNLNRDAIYWHYPHYSNQGGRPGGIIREGNFKLIEFYEDSTYELYNLESDLSETTNLSDSMPEKTEELSTKLLEWRQSVNAEMMDPNPEYDPDYRRVTEQPD